MTTQTINGAAIEIAVILADGKTDPTATLDARETATVEAVDAALRATESFQTAYPQAALVRVDSMRGVEEKRNGRYLPALPTRGRDDRVLGSRQPGIEDQLQKGHRGSGVTGRCVALDRKRGFHRRGLAANCGGGAAFAAKRDRLGRKWGSQGDVPT